MINDIYLLGSHNKFIYSHFTQSYHKNFFHLPYWNQLNRKSAKRICLSLTGYIIRKTGNKYNQPTTVKRPEAIQFEERKSIENMIDHSWCKLFTFQSYTQSFCFLNLGQRQVLLFLLYLTIQYLYISSERKFDLFILTRYLSILICSTSLFKNL